MKITLFLIVLIQFSVAGISNAIKVVNGGLMNIDTTNNWYELTMDKGGNVSFSGTATKGKADTDGMVRYIRVYHKDLSCAGPIGPDYFQVKYLEKGTYYLSTLSSGGGHFTAYSPSMKNSKVTKPKAGTILNPKTPLNNQSIAFGTNMSNNTYVITLSQSDSVLFSGSDKNGEVIQSIHIYDENLNLVNWVYPDSANPQSVFLSQGIYTLVVTDEDGGSFTVSSDYLVYPPPPSSESFPRIMADVNGDGMADVIGFGTKGVSVSLSSAASFDSASLWMKDFGYNQGWRNDTSLRKMEDVNGDGLADVVGFGTKGVSVALSNGVGFDKTSLWLGDFGYNQGWRNDKSLRTIADVNGDGLADIVAFGNKGISVALSTGSDFDQARLWVQDFGYNQGWRNDKGLRFMSDVNGDGKADIVGFGNNGVSVALSNGNSFVNARRWVDDFGYNQGWRNNKGLRFMSDVNGDGKADIVGFGNNGVSVALSNGNSFVNASRWVNDFGYNQGWRNDKGLRVMSDINGDGKADIVGFGNNGVSVAYSNGNSFTGTSRKIDNFGYNQGWKNDKHLRLMADVDGDGTTDVVGFGSGGISASLSAGSNFDFASSWMNDFGYDQGWKVDFSPYQLQQ